MQDKVTQYQMIFERQGKTRQYKTMQGNTIQDTTIY